LRNPANMFWAAVLACLSATRFWLQRRMKRKTTMVERGELVVRWNGQCLAWAILVCLALGFTGLPVRTPTVVLCGLVLIVFIIPFWRCNEILLAFVFDAFGQLQPQGSTRRPDTREPTWRKVIRGGGGGTDLPNVQRIKLALRSDVEIVFDIGLIHFGIACLLPRLAAWRNDPPYSGLGIQGVGDAIYFSAITIATVGYGDIAPAHWSSRLVAVYEIGIGLILLYVSVVVYLSAPQRTTT